MKIHILFLQRHEDYEWQYAPEVLAAVDEYTNDENPEWFIDRCEKEQEAQKGQGTFRVIDVNVSQDQIRDLLLKSPEVEGKIDTQ